MGPKSEKSTFSEALGCRLQLNALLGQCAVDSKGMKYKTARMSHLPSDEHVRSVRVWAVAEALSL